MSIKTLQKPLSFSATTRQRKSYVLALAIASGSLLTGLTTTSMTVQAAGLSDLFSSDKSAGQSKFLPVNQAFQVSTDSTPTKSGTRLSINFDITPEHYVYKKQIKLTLPAGVTAAPFTFSQTPYSMDDPTFGKVLVFDQANMIATTTLTNNSGKNIDNAAIVVGWQGCAKAGLCYPPEKINTTVDIVATSAQITVDNASAANKEAASNGSTANNSPASTTNST